MCGSLLYSQKVAQGLAYRTPSVYTEWMKLTIFGNSRIHLSCYYTFLGFHLPPHCSSLLDSIVLPVPNKIFPKILNSALLHSFPFCFLTNRDQFSPTNAVECWGISIILTRTQIQHSCQDSHNLNSAHQKKRLQQEGTKIREKFNPPSGDKWASSGTDRPASSTSPTLVWLSYINDKEASFLRDHLPLKSPGSLRSECFTSLRHLVHFLQSSLPHRRQKSASALHNKWGKVTHSTETLVQTCPFWPMQLWLWASLQTELRL